MADIHSKLAKIAGEIGSINKTERNKEQGFNFRSIEQITAAARPLLAAEGVSVMPRVLSKEYSEVIAKSGSKGFRCIAEVEYTFTAGSDGSSAVCSMIGEAADYGDKATSKAVQMAYKYALTQVLQVGSGDDPDAHSVDVGHVKESNPRPRSGPQKRTPTPPQSPESDVKAPTTNGIPAQVSLGPDVAAEVKRMKNWAFQQLGKDADKAQAIWEKVVSTYNLAAGLPHADSLDFIESDLSIAIGEALTEELVTP